MLKVAGSQPPLAQPHNFVLYRGLLQRSFGNNQSIHKHPIPDIFNMAQFGLDMTRNIQIVGKMFDALNDQQDTWVDDFFKKETMSDEHLMEMGDCKNVGTQR